MKHILPILLMIVCLVGCATKQAVSSKREISGVTPNGTTFHISSQQLVGADGKSTNPPNISNEPVEITISPEGNATISIGATRIVGAYASLAEIAQNLFVWPIVIGIALIGIGITATFVPYVPSQFKKLGIGLAIAGAAIVAISYTFATYGWVMVIIGSVLILGAIGYFTYNYVINRKALYETVEGVEHLKLEYLDEKEKEKAFDIPTASIPSRQSKKTRKIISEIRKEEGFKGEK